MTKPLSAAGKLLDNNETIEHTTHPSRFNSQLLRKYVAGGFLFVLLLAPIVLPVIDYPEPLRVLFYILFIVPVGFVLYAEMRRYAIMYHFSNKKFIMENGILKKNVSSVAYDNVTKVEIQQDFVDRIIDIGDLRVEVKGQEQKEILVTGVRNPQAFRIHLQGSHDFEDIDEVEDVEDIDVEPAEDGDAVNADQNTEAGAVTDDGRRVLDQQFLEAELGRIQRRKGELEQQYQKGALGEQEYEQRWYMLQGEERLIQRELDQLEERMPQTDE